ncbi:unnamed protein product [Arctia plantaginis]|uniref:Uncharacterized protein n=1 Tax=Arctia plantaginis TaxID=874455 RepID=A0A8S1AXZ9_ARCPL|nr:unnamed protein product [Arctia plantaginis]
MLFAYFTCAEGNTRKTETETRIPVLLEWEESNETVLFYPDNITNSDQNDPFCDRIVAITLFEAQPDGSPYINIAIGVLLDESRILTSFNPFREMIKNKNEMAKIKFTFMSSRKSYMSASNSNVEYYGTFTRTIGCARSVIPMKDDEILFDQWHDPNQKHSPVHDLLVLGTNSPVKLGDLGNKTVGVDDENRKTDIVEAGPIITKFGSVSTYPDQELKLISLGLTSYEPISVYKTIEFAIIDQSYLVDCNFWLPKSWGYFICMRNNPKFTGFASSAMLFSNETLIAIGSFTIWRGAVSVLVFTDVRPYARLINNTCTENDAAILSKAHG